MTSFLVGLVLFVVVVGAKIVFSEPFRALAMRRTDKSSIADAKAGETVRVVGEVEVLDTVEAPLSGRTCAHWQVVVRQRTKGGATVKVGNWTTLIDTHGGEDFLVRDSSGVARVDTAHATALLDPDAEFESHWNLDPTPELEAFVASHGHSTEGLLTNKRLAYFEGIVEVGETVAVVGQASFEPDPDGAARADGGYRDASPPERLVIRATDAGKPVRISDLESARGE